MLNIQCDITVSEYGNSIAINNCSKDMNKNSQLLYHVITDFWSEKASKVKPGMYRLIANEV